MFSFLLNCLISLVQNANFTSCSNKLNYKFDPPVQWSFLFRILSFRINLVYRKFWSIFPTIRYLVFICLINFHFRFFSVDKFWFFIHISGKQIVISCLILSAITIRVFIIYSSSFFWELLSFALSFEQNQNDLSYIINYK